MARMVAAFATGVVPWYAGDHSLPGRQCYETHVDHFEP